MTKNVDAEIDRSDWIAENVKDWEDGEPVFFSDNGIFEPRPRWDYDDYN